MAACARLKNEFTEDEKYHNLMRWLKYQRVHIRQTDAREDRPALSLSLSSQSEVIKMLKGLKKHEKKEQGKTTWNGPYAL